LVIHLVDAENKSSPFSKTGADGQSSDSPRSNDNTTVMKAEKALNRHIIEAEAWVWKEMS